MAAPTTGAWKRQNHVPVQYAGAEVWGTGWNPIHAKYGSAAVRTTPLGPMRGEITPAFEAVPEQITEHNLWGYTTAEDIPGTYLTYDGRPPWGVETPDSPARMSAQGHPPVNASGPARNAFRRIMGGAHRLHQTQVDSIPSETVTEGWRNKATGAIASAEPSADTQLIVRTSMIQRDQTRDNGSALARGTDVPRAVIHSRIRPQVRKVYSGEERHYDMEPREQNDIPRPFYYHHAGTGPAEWMRANETYEIHSIERVPPNDPAIGVSETGYPDYGFTAEDKFYA